MQAGIIGKCHGNMSHCGSNADSKEGQDCGLAQFQNRGDASSTLRLFPAMLHIASISATSFYVKLPRMQHVHLLGVSLDRAHYTNAYNLWHACRGFPFTQED